jgi:hypothetical protein
MSYSGRLARLLSARLVALLGVFLVALLASEIAFSSTALRGSCAETCQDDGPDGQCSPGCDDCFCCNHGRLTVSLPQDAVVLFAMFETTLWPDDAEPSSPEPQEILRVPKSALPLA